MMMSRKEFGIQEKIFYIETIMRGLSATLIIAGEGSLSVDVDNVSAAISKEMKEVRSRGFEKVFCKSLKNVCKTIFKIRDSFQARRHKLLNPSAVLLLRKLFYRGYREKRFNIFEENRFFHYAASAYNKKFVDDMRDDSAMATFDCIARFAMFSMRNMSIFEDECFPVSIDPHVSRLRSLNQKFEQHILAACRVRTVFDTLQHQPHLKTDGLAHLAILSGKCPKAMNMLLDRYHVNMSVYQVSFFFPFSAHFVFFLWGF